MSRTVIGKIGTVLISLSIVAAAIYAASPDTARRMLMEIGRLRLALLACLIAVPVIIRAPAFVGKLFFGLLLAIFFASQGLSMLDTYRNTTLYQRRKIMSISNLQIIDNVFASQRFSGKDVLPILVADYMPHATVFLYDANLYSKELLVWSGRDPDSTFKIGGYEPTMEASFKSACLKRPHTLYKGRSKVPLYIATPLSIYETEKQVFLMRDEGINYLIPGSWRAAQQ